MRRNSVRTPLHEPLLPFQRDCFDCTWVFLQIIRTVQYLNHETFIIHTSYIFSIITWIFFWLTHFVHWWRPSFFICRQSYLKFCFFLSLGKIFVKFLKTMNNSFDGLRNTWIERQKWNISEELSGNFVSFMRFWGTNNGIWELMEGMIDSCEHSRIHRRKKWLLIWKMRAFNKFCAKEILYLANFYSCTYTSFLQFSDVSFELE